MPAPHEESTGGQLSSALLRPEHPGFLDEPAPIKGHLRWLCRHYMKQVGVRIWGGDPHQALTNLARALHPDGERNFDVNWLDLVVEVLGAPAAQHILRVLCERWGFEPPKRKAAAVKLEEQLDVVAGELAAMRAIGGQIQQRLDAVKDHVERKGKKR